MIWRGADVGRVIPGKIQALGGVGHQRNNNLFDLPFPAGFAFLAEFRTQQAVGFEPHVCVPVTVEPWLVAALFTFGGEKITDPESQGEHFRIVISRIGGVLFAVEDGGCQNAIGKVAPSRKCLQRFQSCRGLGIEPGLDLGGTCFQQTEIRAGEVPAIRICRQ